MESVDLDRRNFPGWSGEVEARERKYLLDDYFRVLYERYERRKE